MKTIDHGPFAPGSPAAEIMALERGAMERWGAGDPDGFLEISDPDVVYFDPFLDQRLIGLAPLKALYDSLRGTVHIDHFEFIDPKITISGEMALLTYNFVSYDAQGTPMRWNTTEVYRRAAPAQGAAADAAGAPERTDWKIIHSHWAFTKPALAAS